MLQASAALPTSSWDLVVQSSTETKLVLAITLPIAFPSAPGTYLLRWDLVQEGVSWFSGKGVRMPEQTVAVTAERVARVECAARVAASLSADQGAYLMTRPWPLDATVVVDGAFPTWRPLR